MYDVEQTKRALMKLQVFVLNRETDEIRDELYDYLLMIALKSADEKLSENEIISNIENNLGIKKVSKDKIKEALKRLEEREYINPNQTYSGVKYSLSANKQTELDEHEEEYETNRMDIEQKLISNIKERFGKLDMKEKRGIISDFRNVLGILFREQGIGPNIRDIGFAGKILNHKTDDYDYFVGMDFQLLLEKIVVSSENEELKNIEMGVIKDLILNQNIEMSKYLYSLAQSYYILEILNFDPECNMLLKENFSKNVVYLDTNVTISLLINNDFHLGIKKLIELTKDLGINVLYTKRTEEEYFDVLDHSNNSYQEYKTKINKLHNRTYHKLEKIFPSIFFTDFFSKKYENPTLKWDAYYMKLKQQTRSILKNVYNISIDEKSYEGMYTESEMDELTSLVIAQGSKKNKKTAEHDAYHLLLMEKLREKEEESSVIPNYWFITCDRSLYYVNREYFGEGSVHMSIYFQKWIEMISTLLAPDIANKDCMEVFNDLLIRRLTRVPPVITFDKLKLIGPWMDDEDLTTEEIAKTMGSHYVMELITKESDKPDDDAFDLEKYPEGSNEIMEEIKNKVKKDEKLKSKLKEKDKTISDQEGKLSEKDKTISDQEGKLSEKDKTIGDQAGKLSEKDKTINDFHKKLDNLTRTTDLLKIGLLLLVIIFFDCIVFLQGLNTNAFIMIIILELLIIFWVINLLFYDQMKRISNKIKRNKNLCLLATILMLCTSVVLYYIPLDIMYKIGMGVLSFLFYVIGIYYYYTKLKKNSK